MNSFSLALFIMIEGIRLKSNTVTCLNIPIKSQMSIICDGQVKVSIKNTYFSRVAKYSMLK